MTTNNTSDQYYLKDLGQLLCIITQLVDGKSTECELEYVYIGTWDKIYKKILNDLHWNITDDMSVKHKIHLSAYIHTRIHEYTQTDTINEYSTYKNPKFTFEYGTNTSITINVIPLADVEYLDKVGGRRKKTLKHK